MHAPTRHALLVCSVLLALLALLAPTARAQVVPFVPAQDYFGTGLNWNGVGTTAALDSFEFDRNGDLMMGAGDTKHPIPAGLLAAITQQNYRLAPRRDHFIVTGAAAPGAPNAGASVVYVYRIPSQDGAALEPLWQGYVIPNGRAHVGFFDHPVPNDQRVFYIVGQSPDTVSPQQIHWFDLTSGVGSTTDVAFTPIVDEITFAADGVAALVKYATNASPPVGLSDFRMVNLCASSLGSSYNPTGNPPLGLDGLSTFARTVVSGSDLLGEIVSEGSVVSSFVLDPCDTSSNDTGACCYEDGTCADGLTQAECEGGAVAGTYQGDGSDCAGADCPQPEVVSLSIDASAPASIPSPGTILYTVDYENTGNTATQFTSIYCTIPLQTTFVSASVGGFYNPGTRRVQWSLGTLAPGASGTVSFSVDVPCGLPAVTMSNYWIVTSTPPQPIVLGDAVVTTVGQPNNAPIDANILSVSDAGGPLLRDGTATHTITLANGGAQPHLDLEFSFWLGSVWNLESVVDEGGGAVTVAGRRITWNGDVPASSSVSIVLRTVVPSCPSSATTEDALNFGNAVNVTNACTTVLGSFTPALLALTPPPLSAILEIPGSVSDLDSGGNPNVLVRADEPTVFRFTLTNTYPIALTGVTASTAIVAPASPVADPPWTGTPPSGATWDPATGVVGFDGSLAAGQSVVLEWSVDIASSGGCSFIQIADFAGGSCTTSSSTRLLVFAVPAVPEDPYLIGSAPTGGIFRYASGIDPSLVPLVCLGNELNRGLGIDDDGYVWIMGFPMYRFHPQTLDFEFIEFPELQGAGLNTIYDIAFDGDDIYLGGTRFVTSQFYACIVRWRRATSEFDLMYLEDTTAPAFHREIRDLEVAQDGALIAGTQRGHLRIVPSMPPTVQAFSDSALVAGTRAFGLDVDGDVLVVERVASAPTPLPLWSIDPLTGIFTAEIPDLQALLPMSGLIEGITADDEGRLFLAMENGGLFLVDRAAPTPTVTSIPVGTYFRKQDLEWTSGGGVTVSVANGDDAPPVVLPRELALLPASPNPFNPRTLLRFALPHASEVTLTIHDLRGRRVRTLAGATLPAGLHEIAWSGEDDAGAPLASGVYLVRLEAGPRRLSQKVLLLK